MTNNDVQAAAKEIHRKLIIRAERAEKLCIFAIILLSTAQAASVSVTNKTGKLLKLHCASGSDNIGTKILKMESPCRGLSGITFSPYSTVMHLKMASKNIGMSLTMN
ncbi:unnamed protein product [Rhizophagus irregularis]|nr:unnamed protein product [Rhizophagus irregularis]